MASASLCDDRGSTGFSWTMDEVMQRTSHVLGVDGRVWLIDPIDEPIALARLAAIGEPAGVIQLLDRHGRDCAAIAQRLGVPHHECPSAVTGAPFTFQRLTWRPWWREVALWWEAERLLVVAEAVGTGRYFTVGRGVVGVHPMLRMVPPHRLLRFSPHTLLVGHGRAVRGDQASDGLQQAIADARRGIPALVRTIPSLRHR
jgi:hypothetical protein